MQIEWRETKIVQYLFRSLKVISFESRDIQVEWRETEIVQYVLEFSRFSVSKTEQCKSNGEKQSYGTFLELEASKLSVSKANQMERKRNRTVLFYFLY